MMCGNRSSSNVQLSLILSSVALQPFVGLWPLLQFRKLFYTVGRTPWTGIGPSQGRYLHTEQNKHRINAHTNIHVLSGIRTHNPSVHALDGEATVIGNKQL
jgi:hypothetical protein